MMSFEDLTICARPNSIPSNNRLFRKTVEKRIAALNAHLG